MATGYILVNTGLGNSGEVLYKGDVAQRYRLWNRGASTVQVTIGDGATESKATVNSGDTGDVEGKSIVLNLVAGTDCPVEYGPIKTEGLRTVDHTLVNNEYPRTHVYSGVSRVFRIQNLTRENTLKIYYDNGSTLVHTRNSTDVKGANISVAYVRVNDADPTPNVPGVFSVEQITA